MSRPVRNLSGRVASDAATIAAISILAYAISNVLHEGLGHGGACLVVGGKARGLSSTYFDCDTAGLPGWAVRLISAGGTLANLVVAAVAFPDPPVGP